MKQIEVSNIIDSVPTSDGAGVKLKRSIGTPLIDYLDPFLMLDEFGSENKDDYIGGFPPHPHRGIETVGIYKPDAKVYEMPIKKYGCKPENICFLSSNTWDVSGGGVFGYNAIWVNRFNKVFDKLSYKPQFVINNLNELLEIV